jgi:hypothetical protein
MLTPMTAPLDDSAALDELLAQDFLMPPADFTEQLMRRVQTLPMPAVKPPRENTLRESLKWLALLGGAALGAAELLAFMFGLWASTAAA